jgi:protein-S-isoprenylcysteine O-methyltransferase Ste14
MNEPAHQAPSHRVSLRAVLRTALGYIVLLVILAGLLFVPAGRWDWFEGWLFIALYTVLIGSYAAWGHLKDPEQFRERRRIAENTKPWDRAILMAYTLLLPAPFVVAGLDAGRFQWSSVPVWLQALAWLGLLAAGSLVLAAVVTNTYLSRSARIQDDRHQVVVTAGPYRLVRHPMYLGVILVFACLPLALGSWWALIPGVLIAGLFVIRTSAEDAMLRSELEGYGAYARKVRYRLVPGLW